MIRIPRSSLLVACAGLAIGTIAAPACMAWWPGASGERTAPAEPHAVSEYLRTGREANVMWPYPYVCPDRTSTQAPFEVMVTNGWRRQNLLGSHHFDTETGKLTKAGELKVRWIVTQAPPQRRQVFIERSIDPEVTSKRAEVAQQFANGATFDGSEAVVMDTHLEFTGRSAATVDLVQNSFRESMPPPVLPAGTTSTSAGSN